jgi:ubiquinone/menaquinone biosynthesis C-methylase UbiE
VRRDTYDVDLGQSSGITLAEAREWLRVSFQLVDAGQRLPFPDASFDALFCDDAINHLPDRARLFADWHRVLKPGGRLLFTDPVVVTGRTRARAAFIQVCVPRAQTVVTARGGDEQQGRRDRRCGDARGFRPAVAAID